MQPFDGSKFDKRYEEIFKPAIIAAGLEAYRVDKDPSVSIPITELEQGIKDSQLCLAEITEDNPNVWFELGYAIACNKEVVLVCSKERTTKFPFDVQHRTIIHYGTGSPSEYEYLKRSITEKIIAYVKKQENINTSIAEIQKFSPIQRTTNSDGLTDHEIATIAVLTGLLDHSGDACTVYQIKQSMENSGYTKVATVIALRSLEQQNYISQGTEFDDHSNRDYVVYSLTDKGWHWVLSNQDRFYLRNDDGPIPF
jgi:DNA-binding MarR family transcriptional regulator